MLTFMNSHIVMFNHLVGQSKGALLYCNLHLKFISKYSLLLLLLCVYVCVNMDAYMPWCTCGSQMKTCSVFS